MDSNITIPWEEKGQPRSLSFSRISQGTSTQEERQGDSESKKLAKGPNPALRKGPNDDLLL